MKNKRKTIGAIAMFVLIISIFLIGYVYVNHYQKIDIVSGQANIARWSFGSKNTEAKISLSDEKISPGSNGNFEIEVDATDSEVEVEYTILVTDEKNIPTNMKFYAEIFDEKGGVIKTTDLYDSFTSLAKSDLLSNFIPVEKGNQKRKILVYWNWEFNENDTSDVDRNDAILSYDENGNSSLDCGFSVQIVGKQAI